MISCFLYGGLGNQLFQKAAALSHSLRHGYDVVIPEEVVNPHSRQQKPYRFPGFKYSSNISTELSAYKEPFFHYSCLPPMDNIKLDGYFQSAKYFDDYRDEVIESFGFNISRTIKGMCGVHVRRGDYLKWPNHHPPVTRDYILKAIGMMKEKLGIRAFMFFSDDIDWCKEFFYCVKDYVEFSEGKDELEDLRMLASLPHHIGSNSSFSWWGHYLCPDENKVGYFPKRWFGPELPHDTRDLYLRSMILL